MMAKNIPYSMMPMGWLTSGGQEGTRQRTDQRACRPREVGQEGNAGKVPRTDRIMLGGSDGKYLVRDGKAEKKARGNGKAGIHALGQRDRHERVAQIDDKLRQRHFDQRAVRRNDGQSRRLPEAERNGR